MAPSREKKTRHGFEYPGQPSACVAFFFFYAVSTKSFEIEALLAGSALMPYFQKQR